ncbi:putative methyltransferase-domain-containing protein [Phycomyces nitens]|nr:putative methyltransferase-domain-containing protein [Phycomyces nitens]
MLSFQPVSPAEIPCTNGGFWNSIVNKRESATIEADKLDFEKTIYRSLSKSTTLHRLILERNVESTILENTWQKVHLHIVTEMGLLMDSNISSITNLNLEVSVLVQCPRKEWINDMSIKVDIRGLSWSEWSDTKETLWPGFQNSALGGLEYRIRAGSTNPLPKKPFYLYIRPSASSLAFSMLNNTSQNLDVLPLAIGPISIANKTLPDTNGAWGPRELQVNQIHRALAYPLLGIDRYFLLKERWGCGTPGKLWDSAIVLSNMFSTWFINDPQALAQKRIVDLSAGTGFLGLFISHLYQSQGQDAPSITLTDIPEALSIIRENEQFNHMHAIKQVKIKPLSWGSETNARSVRDSRVVDIVLASDVLYNECDFPLLIKTLCDLSTPKKTIIYLGYKRRGFSQKEEDMFFSMCSSHFHVSEYGSSVAIDGQAEWEKTMARVPNRSHSIDSLLAYSEILENTGVRIYRLVRKDF